MQRNNADKAKKAPHKQDDHSKNNFKNKSSKSSKSSKSNSQGVKSNKSNKPSKAVKPVNSEKPVKSEDTTYENELVTPVVMESEVFMEVEITDLGDSGEGVGRHEGMTVFVPGGLPGDLVMCKVIEQKKSFAKAKLLHVKEPSPHRIDAPCEIYDQCGGCQIQDYAYKAQLELKQSMVENALKRIGGIECEVAPIIGMENPFRYRNKGVYPVQGTFDKPKIGFYKKQSHTVVNAKDCLLQDIQNASIINAIRKHMKDFKVSPYDPRFKSGSLKNVMIRKSEATGEVMVVLVTAGSKFSMTKTLVESLLKACPSIVSIQQSIQPSNSIKGLGETSKLLYGKETIKDKIGGLSFEISPSSFYQVNSVQTEKLYAKALEFAALSGTENVYELYSGTGTISLFLAQKAKWVYGIEIISEAVDNALENAKVNQIENVSFILGDAEEEIAKLYEAGHSADVVVVDPPRSGCEGTVIESILAMAPQRIVYVSCKPATLARDLKMLCDGGAYKVTKVQPVDVFGHTAHVECVALIEKK
ncbi:23S rRNA (uracil(1939)-C(5))-methyltransferase RlmD [Fusibacter bizertensis]|uniref:23S rRNA (Uracil(1939)-C(5))-methyltransferase RlmD n=1 Tax=Fusibacter bizertensis TaxID=1488331 RepID=A0ABT6NF94_9FIRM|nr:23S rRNA (uracil(1939)-C(5))-methyltransferase RlmD [Fusibacter bizertensis]MDH8679102.1 23S rRNA (uracil(1939)-C(5))-methyltransferase RlmD [Fusibacter bizertensis]